jgi:hypothetical protein
MVLWLFIILEATQAARPNPAESMPALLPALNKQAAQVKEAAVKKYLACDLDRNASVNARIAPKAEKHAV